VKLWTKIGLGASAAAVLATLLSHSARAVSGPPSSKVLVWRLPPKGAPGGLQLTVAGLPPTNSAQWEIARHEAQAVWKARKRALPRGADPINADSYAREQYWLPTMLMLSQPIGAWEIAHPSSTPVDEFGRPFAGHWGAGPSNIWDQTLGGLLKNPLFQYAVLAAAIATGPGGLAVYGAYTLWQARGTKLTVENAVLVSARTYAVSQCGPACGAAFDFGVGVASGKSYDRAAEDTLVGQMTPEQRVAYRQGKDNVHKLGL
jgi:hypothetical protein